MGVAQGKQPARVLSAWGDPRSPAGPPLGERRGVPVWRGEVMVVRLSPVHPSAWTSLTHRAGGCSGAPRLAGDPQSQGHPGAWRWARGSGELAWGGGQQPGSGVQLSPGGSRAKGGVSRGCQGAGAGLLPGASPAGWERGSGSIARAPSPALPWGSGHPPHSNTPHRCGAGARQGGGPAPRALQHPEGSCTPILAPTLAMPGGPSPFTAASVVPGAGAGGAEVQRGRGAGVGDEAMAVTVTVTVAMTMTMAMTMAMAVTVEGLRRAGGGGREVLSGEQRAGCHRGIRGVALGPCHPKGDLKSVTLWGDSRKGSLGGAAPAELGAAGQQERRLQRVPGACRGAGQGSPSSPAVSYLCGAGGCRGGGTESHGHAVGQDPVAPGACVGRGGEGRTMLGPSLDFGERPALGAKFQPRSLAGWPLDPVLSPPPPGCHLHRQPPASAWPRVSILLAGWRTRPEEEGGG